MNVTIDQVQSAFPQGAMEGHSWRTLCPVHGDTGAKAPNLLITPGEKLLAHCNAGCNQGDVFKAVITRLKPNTPALPSLPYQNPPAAGQPGGLSYTVAQLERAERQLSKASAFLEGRGISLEVAQRLHFGFETGPGFETGYLVMPYFVDGELAAAKFRATKTASREKKWRKWRRDEKTSWLFNRDSLKVSDVFDECIIQESELDAAMLESMGKHAVSVDTAGHKLTEADAALLKAYSGRLLFAPDTDRPGITCALRIAEEIGQESASAIKPPTKDLGDLYKQDPAAFLEKFEELRKNATPIWQTAFRSVEQLDTGEPRVLIDKFLVEGNSMIGAASGVGKTWFQLSMAKALCTGEPFLGVFAVPEKVKVIYLIPEAGDRGFRKRCERMGLPMRGDTFLCRTMKDGILRLDDLALEMAVKDWKPVIFLDTAIRFSGSKDENSSSENAAEGGLAFCISNLLNLGAAAVVSAHHSPKNATSVNKKNKFEHDADLQNTLRGTSDMGAMCDTVWNLRHDDGGPEAAHDYLEESKSLTRLYVQCVKPRDFEPADPFVIQGKPHIDQRGDFVVLTAQDSAPDISIGARAAKELEADPTLSKSALAKKLGVSRNLVTVPGWHWEPTGRTTGTWQRDKTEQQAAALEPEADGF